MRLSTSKIVLGFCAALLLAAALPSVASAAASWQEGPLVESQDFNCITGDVEQEAGSYLGYYADPSSPPQVGQVFYVSIDMAGIGDTCAGMYADAHLVLPPGVTPAVSGTNPVKCFFNTGSQWQRDASSDCPQSLPLEAFSGGVGYSVNPRNVNPPFWPLPQGLFLEIQIPVVASQPLDGSAPMRGFVELADGENDPTLAPELNMIVDPSSTPTQQQIGIFYNDPSISSQSPNTDGSVNVYFSGRIDNNSNTGTAEAQLAKADSAGDCQNPSSPPLVKADAPLHSPDTAISPGDFTELYPGGAYCWRLVAFVNQGGGTVEYDGNWQYFATIGSYINGGNPTYEPPPAQPTGVSQCKSDGSGCATSNCNAGASCSSGGSVSGFSHTLLLSFLGTGTGSVSGPAKFACSASCGGSFAPGSKVTLTAKASPGSRFAGWSGGVCSGTATCTVTMSADQMVKATFMLLPPVCSLTPRSNQVAIQRSRSRRILAGTLSFSVACNQAAGGSVAGTLTTVLHGVRRHYAVSGRVSVFPNNTSLFVLKLPLSAVKALTKGAKEKLTLTLTATNVNGTGRTSASLSRLRH